MAEWDQMLQQQSLNSKAMLIYSTFHFYPSTLPPPYTLIRVKLTVENNSLTKLIDGFFSCAFQVAQLPLTKVLQCSLEELFSPSHSVCQRMGKLVAGFSDSAPWTWAAALSSRKLSWSLSLQSDHRNPALAPWPPVAWLCGTGHVVDTVTQFSVLWGKVQSKQQLQVDPSWAWRPGGRVEEGVLNTDCSKILNSIMLLKNVWLQQQNYGVPGDFTEMNRAIYISQKYFRLFEDSKRHSYICLHSGPVFRVATSYYVCRNII